MITDDVMPIKYYGYLMTHDRQAGKQIITHVDFHKQIFKVVMFNTSGAMRMDNSEIYKTKDKSEDFVWY